MTTLGVPLVSQELLSTYTMNIILLLSLNIRTP